MRLIGATRLVEGDEACELVGVVVDEIVGAEDGLVSAETMWVGGMKGKCGRASQTWR